MTDPLPILFALLCTVTAWTSDTEVPESGTSRSSTERRPQQPAELPSRPARDAAELFGQPQLIRRGIGVPNGRLPRV